jgi:hypothetical protein
MNENHLPHAEDNGPDLRAALAAEAQHKRDEWRALVAERRRLETTMASLRQYLDVLNPMLRTHGVDPVDVADAAPKTGVGFATPGNRAKNMPPRRPEYQDTSITRAVEGLLQDGRVMHVDDMVREIYELHNDREFHAAKQSVASTAASWAKRGRWERGEQPNTFRLKRASGGPASRSEGMPALPGMMR